MSLFIKIGKDGKEVYVAKTLFSSSISEEEFQKKAERMTVSEFISKYSKEIDENLRNKIKRVREIHDMKLCALGCINTYDNNMVKKTYFAGDEIIDEGYAGNDVREEAILYAKRFYGSEFIKKNLDKLESENITYFSKEQEIPKQEYLALKEELKQLTKLITIKKEINIKFKR